MLFVENETDLPHMFDGIKRAPFFLPFMLPKPSSRDGKSKEKLIYPCFLWFYCWCNFSEVSGIPAARVPLCWAMLRHFDVKSWLSTSGKCFSVSAQHEKGVNWLVDGSLSSVVRHTFDLLNNASYIVWCNSKWKAIILADRFKKCLGEQMSIYRYHF